LKISYIKWAENPHHDEESLSSYVCMERVGGKKDVRSRLDCDGKREGEGKSHHPPQPGEVSQLIEVAGAGPFLRRNTKQVPWS